MVKKAFILLIRKSLKDMEEFHIRCRRALLAFIKIAFNMTDGKYDIDNDLDWFLQLSHKVFFNIACLLLMGLFLQWFYHFIINNI